MKRYRFYVIQKGVAWYLMDDLHSFTTRRESAQLFTEAMWHDWGEDQEFQREEIAEDEAMRLAGAPMLPGMEA